MPLGDTHMTGHSMMFNWIGEMPDAASVMQVPGVHWHDYGKAPRPGRKIGHATLTADSAEQLKARANEIAQIAGGDFPALIQQFD